MTITIPYGKDDQVSIEVPDKNVAQVIYPNKVEVGDEATTLLRAIERPIQSKSFDDFLRDARDVLFIVNDGTRPTPTAKIFDIIHDRIRNQNITILIATGVHRAPMEDEYRFIFGKYYDEFKDRIHVHDCRKIQDMVHIGTSRSGTEMYVNKLGMAAQKIVILGSVEPHYFAGYTGGRKSFLPGIASYHTIEQNHRHALKAGAKALALDGNPVHEDMIDALKTIADKEIFSIQTVLDAKRRIYGATAGHIHDSFYGAVGKASEVFCVRIREKADIVVSIVPYPMDVDLYQSQKALDNGKLALKEGGILILISRCRTGIGEKAFFELLSSMKTPQEVLARVNSEFRLGWHKAAKMAEIATWAEMWGVTDLNDSDLSAIFIRPYHDVQTAINDAIKKKGSDAKVLFLMDGAITVPVSG